MAEELIKPDVGSVFYMDLGKNLPPGHEQTGKRPCLIASIPSDHGKSRYNLFIVIPFTSFKDQSWAKQSPNLYPIIKAKEDELEHDSVALLDQIRTVDFSRIKQYVGRLNQTDFQDIMNKLKALFKKKDSKP